MPLPDEDVALVRRYVDSLNEGIPHGLEYGLRYELESHRNAVTISEINSPPQGAEYAVPVARLRFTRLQGWELFYPDRNSDFHI